MKYVTPVVRAWVGWAEPERYARQWKDDLDRMSKLAEGLDKGLIRFGDSREEKLRCAMGEFNEHRPA